MLIFHQPFWGFLPLDQTQQPHVFWGITVVNVTAFGVARATGGHTDCKQKFPQTCRQIESTQWASQTCFVHWSIVEQARGSRGQMEIHKDVPLFYLIDTDSVPAAHPACKGTVCFNFLIDCLHTCLYQWRTLLGVHTLTPERATTVCRRLQRPKHSTSSDLHTKDWRETAVFVLASVRHTQRRHEGQGKAKESG